MRGRSGSWILPCSLSPLFILKPIRRIRLRLVLVLRGGENLTKDKRKSWRNFNVRTTDLGIFREVMNP
jgi:hypothetical protein